MSEQGYLLLVLARFPGCGYCCLIRAICQVGSCFEMTTCLSRLHLQTCLRVASISPIYARVMTATTGDIFEDTGGTFASGAQLR